jgi:hypothetical protein
MVLNFFSKTVSVISIPSCLLSVNENSGDVWADAVDKLREETARITNCSPNAKDACLIIQPKEDLKDTLALRFELILRSLSLQDVAQELAFPVVSLSTPVGIHYLPNWLVLHLLSTSFIKCCNFYQNEIYKTIRFVERLP